MDKAVAGLLGAVIGAAITAIASILIEARRAWAKAKKERQARLATVRTAVRLLDMEFMVTEAVLKTQIRGKYWTRSAKTAPLERQAWPRYATELASDVAYDDWPSVTRGVLAHGLVVAFAPREEGPLTEDEIDRLERYLTLVKEAREAISGYLKTGTREPHEGHIKGDLK
jgi:hypothetical protein